MMKQNENFVVGKTIVEAKIIKIAKTYVLASFGYNIGICHISNVSDYVIHNLNGFFKLKHNYHFLIIGNDNYDQFNLSYKAIHPKCLKYHANVIETPNGFVNLKKDLIERLKRL